jgi:hypothetical protein
MCPVEVTKCNTENLAPSSRFLNTPLVKQKNRLAAFIMRGYMYAINIAFTDVTLQSNLLVLAHTFGIPRETNLIAES